MSRRRRLVATVASAGLVLITFATASRGSSPQAQTIDGSHPVSWDFGAAGGPSAASDTHDLTVKLPEAASTFYAPDVLHGTKHAAALSILISYAPPSSLDTLSLSAVDPQGNLVGNSTLSTMAASPDAAGLFIQNPIPGKYTITVSGTVALGPQAVASHAVATLKLVDLTKTKEPPSSPANATFVNYELPQSKMPITPEEIAYLGHRAFGEPTIGVNPKTDAAFYQAGLYTMKATWDRAQPAHATWTNITSPITKVATLDAILFTDRSTGRVFVSQLTGACSITAYSDNDGKSWVPAAKPCETPPAVDHQTLGAGPFRPPLPGGVIYPNAVYYCSQNVVEAECATSLDGGLTFGTANPMYTLSSCFGLHGHIKVAPDGTAYVPNKGCGAPECGIVSSDAGPNCHRAVVVSRNNGLTWTVRTIPDSHDKYLASGDPSVAIGSKGTVYVGYDDRDGHPKVAVSHDNGATWAKSVDVSSGFPIQNTEMPVIVAGDDNRAAFAFMGSPYPGQDQDARFRGTWFMYVSLTYDGGKTWHTVNATPGKPIQRGCIEFDADCPSGGRAPEDCSGPPRQLCPNQRNLLDFNDITVDREGRVLVAYTDGCEGKCLTDATYLSGDFPGGIRDPAVLRQDCGRGLYAAYDAKTVCAAAVTEPSVVPSKKPGLATTGGGLLLALGGTTALALLFALGWLRRRLS
ncbi:MAG: sialidase family protein [Actinomycetes bacterium]